MYLYKKSFCFPPKFRSGISKNILVNYIDGAVLDEIINILKICDAGKYAPNHKVENDKLILKTKTALQKLNKILK